MTKPDFILKSIGDALLSIGLVLFQVKASQGLGYCLPFKTLSSIDFFLASGILIYLSCGIFREYFPSRK